LAGKLQDENAWIKMKYLNIDAQNQVRVSLESLVGESVAILGIRGSGKTNTAAVLIEELLSNGLPITIVDIEGEYWGLKEKFEILVIGKSPNTDIEVSPQQAGRFAEFSVKNNVSMILDLSEFTQSEMLEFLLRYFRALWKHCFTERKPYEVVLEEAHEFVPQTTRGPLKEILTRIALRGRKRGLGMILISQRSAKVEKDVLTQAAILLLHRVVHPIDIKIYQEIIPLPSRQVEEMVAQLKRGEAIFYANHEVIKIRIRPRETFHAGATPELNPTASPTLRKIDGRMLEELRLLARQSNEDEEEDTVRQLKRQLVEKETEIEQQRRTIGELRTQIDILSKLSLSVDELPIVVTQIAREESESSANNETEIEQSAAEKARRSIARTLASQHDSVPDKLSDEATAEIKRQERRFSILLEDLSRLPRFHRSILCFLLEREDLALNAKELAKWLSLTETTIRNNPPLDLIKMRLLSRSGRRGGYVYRSAVRQVLGSEFPALDSDLMIERILVNCG
jgi:ABC-type hemin transport system ATPase subunit